MKKFLIILLVLGGLLLAGSWVFSGKVDGMIADAIRTEGTAALGTQVSVGGVETKLADGKAIVSGIEIANPAKWGEGAAIRIGTVAAEVDYKNQSIEKIAIIEPVINAQMIGMDSNFQAILDGIPRQNATTSGEGKATEITIQRLELLAATANLDSDQLGQASFTMDDLVITGLHGTPKELSTVIGHELVAHVRSQLQGYMTKQVTKMATDKAKQKLEEKIGGKLSDKFKDRLKELKLGSD